MAKLIGWTNVHEEERTYSGDRLELGLHVTYNLLLGVKPGGTVDEPVSPYELSVDACLKDVAPWLYQKGRWLRLRQSDTSWYADLTPSFDCGKEVIYALGTKAAKAICLAVKKLGAKDA